MNDRRRDSDDDVELQGIAMAAFHEHERSVSEAETDAALRSVRARLDAGDMGDSSIVLADSARRRRRSPVVMFAAAATVIAVVSLGLVAVLGGGRADAPIASEGSSLPPTESVVTAVEPVITTVAPEPATTSAPTTAPAVTVPTTADSRVPQTIAVDAANPPPLLDVVAFASVPLAENPNGNWFSVGIGADVVGVYQPDTSSLSVVDRTSGAVEVIEVDDRLGDLVIGPGNVAYGFGEVIQPAPGEPMPGPLPIVAIALAGERQGEVVASELLDLNRWLEHPRYPLGHGPDGVVGRIRQVNETLIGYVDELGEPLEPGDEAFPFVAIDGGRSNGPEAGGVVSTDDGRSWNLDVAVAPTNAGGYVGPSAPAPSSGNRVIYADRIGEDLAPDQDFGPYAMPVVAVLDPDGSGAWYRLPEDWDVVASDVWGTVLARTVGDTIELALLDDALPDAPGGIAAGTAVAATPTGVFVADDTDTWSTQVLDDVTDGVALLIDGLVVHHVDGGDPQPIRVVDGDEVREITDGGKRLSLLDVGHVDGRAQILATSETALPVGPDDVDSRLLLIDALTSEVTDLGEFGGWEDAILDGRFVEGAISLLRVQSTNYSVLIVEYDGEIRSSTDVGVDRRFTLVDFDAAVWVLESRFVGNEFEPVLVIRKVAVATGELNSTELPLILDGVDVPAGYCATADFLDGRIVCDQSDGPPISITIADGTTVAVPGLEEGAVRFRASQ